MYYIGRKGCAMKQYSFTISKKAEIMSEEEKVEYIAKLIGVKHYIHDINVTCKMEPFMSDAHGVVMEEKDNRLHIEQMLQVQKATGIGISLVFNNIYVSNDMDTLELFMDNFENYYNVGIRNVTLPHMLWMKTGKIQKRFPDLYIKSTVLRRVRSGQEFWNYALAGFHCVNVDRLLYRNLNALREIKRAQKTFYENYGKYVDISMVIDENCIGSCPFWEEHYQHSMTSKICQNYATNVEGFDLVPKYSGCKSFEKVCMKRVNLIGFKEDMEAVFENIDIIKIGGRRFKVDAFKLMSSIIDSELVCHPLLHAILVRGNKDEVELLQTWKAKVQNCAYQCWECNLCDELDKIVLKGRIREWKHHLSKKVL